MVIFAFLCSPLYKIRNIFPVVCFLLSLSCFCRNTQLNGSQSGGKYQFTIVNCKNKSEVLYNVANNGRAKSIIFHVQLLVRTRSLHDEQHIVQQHSLVLTNVKFGAIHRICTCYQAPLSSLSTIIAAFCFFCEPIPQNKWKNIYFLFIVTISQY